MNVLEYTFEGVTDVEMASYLKRTKDKFCAYSSGFKKAIRKEIKDRKVKNG